MHKLDGPRLKITRAKAEIERLRLAEDTFRANTKYNVVRKELNPKSGNIVCRLCVEGLPPSLEWGVYIGEIAHNLRSALDGTVYQLALLNTETPAWNTQFPIFLVGHTTKLRPGKRKELIPHFEGMRRSDGRSMISSLTRKHQTLIEGLQPYERRSSAKLKAGDPTKWSGRDSPLFWLKEINNADKHRLIHVAGAVAGGWGTTYWGHRDHDPFTRITWGILEDGAIFGEVEPDVNVDTQINPLIAFANGCEVVSGKWVWGVLNCIANRVSEIVESFAPEFDRL